MYGINRQQQTFICAVLLLLLTGYAVKTWRKAHPPIAAIGRPALVVP